MKKWLLACSIGVLMASAITAQADKSDKPALSQAEIKTQAIRAPVVISNARIRLMPEDAKISALYMTLKNNSDKAVSLVSAEVLDTKDHKPLANEVMLHQTVTKGNVKKMEHVSSVNIAPGKTTKLKPGGNHIMLIGLKHSLKEDQTYDVKLSFVDKSVIFTTATVKKISFKKKPALTKEWHKFEHSSLGS